MYWKKLVKSVLLINPPAFRICYILWFYGLTKWATSDIRSHRCRPVWTVTSVDSNQCYCPQQTFPPVFVAGDAREEAVSRVMFICWILSLSKKHFDNCLNMSIILKGSKKLYKKYIAMIFVGKKTMSISIKPLFSPLVFQRPYRNFLPKFPNDRGTFLKSIHIPTKRAI